MNSKGVVLGGGLFGFGFESGSDVPQAAPAHNVARTSKLSANGATSPSLALRIHWLTSKTKNRDNVIGDSQLLLGHAFISWLSPTG